MQIQVKNIDHLKSLATRDNGDFVDFYITLAGGLAKSSKRIQYNSNFDEFSIIHEIDESYQEVIASELCNKTNIVQAIENNCLFKSN
jgi:hypothetical protein